jgi:hypothetical protein
VDTPPSKKLDKFIDDSASTCDDSASTCISDETGIDDCMEFVSSRLDWAEEMREYEDEAPMSREDLPGFRAMPSESFAVPPGQWTLGNLNGPPGKLVDPLRNCGPVPASSVVSFSVSSATTHSRHCDLVASVKSLQRSDPEAWFKYTAEYGENTRDPKKHTTQFLKNFLQQYNDGIPTASIAACSKLDAPLALGLPGNVATLEKFDAPPGNLHTRPGKMFAPPGKLAGLPEKLDAPPGQLYAQGSCTSLSQRNARR